MMCSVCRTYSLSLLRNSFDCNISRLKAVRKYTQHAPGKTDKWEWTMPEGYNTGIKVNNSYITTRKSVPLIVQDPNYVTWYACGPTVYDYSHIGHASTYLQFDMIRRILTNFFNLKICMIMGITNMDNKIVNRALLYNKGFMDVANKYERKFVEDMENLNILPPTSYVRVTEIIPHIIQFVEAVIKQKQAYVTEKGNVYLDYRTAHQPVAKLMGEYYESDASMTDKTFEKDISLWKIALPGEPYWDSPWSKGRPGWHIECSVMASMCFGDKLDIHTGARDLRFPHHEYEIAQCDAYHGCKQWVNYFLHTGHVNVAGGEKMSKSLGNFITIRDVLKEARDPDILRLMCAHNKWSKNFKISDVEDEAEEFYDSVTSLLKLCKYIASGRIQAKVNAPRIEQAIEFFESGIVKDFQDDFNIKQAFYKLKKLMKQVETGIELQDEPSDVQGVLRAIFVIEKFLDDLGFTLHRRIQY